MKTLLETTYLMKNKIDELEKKEKLTLEEKETLKQMFSDILLSVNSEVYISDEIIKKTHHFYYSKLNELLMKDTETVLPPEPPEIQKTSIEEKTETNSINTKEEETVKQVRKNKKITK